MPSADASLISIAAVPSPLSVKETNAGCPEIENVKSSLSSSVAEMATDFATPSVDDWLPMAASTGAVFIVSFPKTTFNNGFLASSGSSPDEILIIPKSGESSTLTLILKKRKSPAVAPASI